VSIANPSAPANNAGDNTGGSVTSVATGSMTIPASSLCIAVVQLDNNASAIGDPASVSDGTNSYTKAVGVSCQNDIYTSIWYCYDSSGGTRTVTASNFNGTGASILLAHLRVYTVASAASTSPLDQFGSETSAAGTTASVATNGNIAQADELSIVTLSIWGSGADSWAPTGYTSLMDVVDARNVRLAIAYKNQLTAGSPETTANVTVPSGVKHDMAIATFKGGGILHTQTLSAAQGQSVSLPRTIARGAMTTVQGQLVSAGKAISKILIP
jgi:hypothetical protein